MGKGPGCGSVRFRGCLLSCGTHFRFAHYRCGLVRRNKNVGHRRMGVHIESGQRQTRSSLARSLPPFLSFSFFLSPSLGRHSSRNTKRRTVVVVVVIHLSTSYHRVFSDFSVVRRSFVFLLSSFVLTLERTSQTICNLCHYLCDSVTQRKFVFFFFFFHLSCRLFRWFV